MDNKINSLIVSEKEKLRKKSKDYINNFKKISNFIEKEVLEIEKFKNSKISIIPEIKFKDLANQKNQVIKDIEKRGCIIIRKVFDEIVVNEWNKNLEEYIDENNNTIKKQIDGHEARILQHEIDHLSGKLFVDYLSSLKRNILIKKVKKLQNLKKNNER